MENQYPKSPRRTASDATLLPPHGGYRKLKSFQVAQLVYDLTVRFCDRYIERRSRTHDQIPSCAYHPLRHHSGLQITADQPQHSFIFDSPGQP